VLLLVVYFFSPHRRCDREGGKQSANATAILRKNTSVVPVFVDAHLLKPFCLDALAGRCYMRIAVERR
jgi:hypothetical protein